MGTWALCNVVRWREVHVLCVCWLSISLPVRSPPWFVDRPSIFSTWRGVFEKHSTSCERLTFESYFVKPIRPAEFFVRKVTANGNLGSREMDRKRVKIGQNGVIGTHNMPETS